MWYNAFNYALTEKGGPSGFVLKRTVLQYCVGGPEFLWDALCERFLPSPICVDFQVSCPRCRYGLAIELDDFTRKVRADVAEECVNHRGVILVE